MKYKDIVVRAKEFSPLDLESEVNNISIDTRTLMPGNVYIAIQGEHHDGHDYLQMAKEKGAIAAVVSRKIPCDIPQVIVEDTTIALGDIAKYWRQKFSMPVIAITGSVGKTTVRNMVAKILINAFGADKVLVPEKNFNNHWGLPLILSRLKAQHQYVVVEMGMNHLEEIRYLMKIAQPTIGIITNAGTNHIGLVGSLENIAKAKGEMFEELSATASAVINADDNFYEYWRSLLTQQKIYTFGLNSGDVTALNIRQDVFTLCTPMGEIEIQRNLLGIHNVVNALAAAAAVLSAGLDDLVLIKRGLEMIAPEPGRLEAITSSQGVIILNDTYNGGETSTVAGLQVLSEYKSVGRKIAVIGDMSELENYAVAMHQAMAGHVARVIPDEFIAFGPMMKYAYDVYAGENKHHFLTHEEVVNYLKLFLKKDDVVLLKGARVMSMEKIFEALMCSSENKVI